MKVQMSDLARNSDASAHLERIPLQFHVDSQIFASETGLGLEPPLVFIPVDAPPAVCTVGWFVAAEVGAPDGRRLGMGCCGVGVLVRVAAGEG